MTKTEQHEAFLARQEEDNKRRKANLEKILKGRIIAFDFDGTITERNEYPKIGTLRQGMDECINTLYEHGAEIIIWTCRALHPENEEVHNTCYLEMLGFLAHHGIKYHQINKNTIPLGTNPGPKIYACLYVDDKGLYFNKNCNGASLWCDIIDHFKKF